MTLYNSKHEKEREREREREDSDDEGDVLRKEFVKMDKSVVGENSLSQADLTALGADGVVSIPRGGGRAVAR